MRIEPQNILGWIWLQRKVSRILLLAISFWLFPLRIQRMYYFREKNLKHARGHILTVLKCFYERSMIQKHILPEIAVIMLGN